MSRRRSPAQHRQRSGSRPVAHAASAIHAAPAAPAAAGVVRVEPDFKVKQMKVPNDAEYLQFQQEYLQLMGAEAVSLFFSR